MATGRQPNFLDGKNIKDINNTALGTESTDTESTTPRSKTNSTSQFTPLRTMVDGNQDIFKYGLFKYEDSKYEDPTLLGFTIELDDKSALFNDVLPFLEKHGSTRSEMNARIPVYKEFVSKIKQIFNSQESVKDEADKSKFIKQHYINSVSGFNLLTQKFNKWREDKLTIELYEDITLFSSYISALYNNLVYSYENGRMILPENLLKFNMYIKISEIRNLTSIAGLNSPDIQEQQIAQALKNNVTCIVYKLYDCEFSFFDSQPIPEIVTQSGIDASSQNPSVLNLDIFFKSVSRQNYNPLIINAITMNDNNIDLDVKIVGSNGQASTTGQISDPSATTINSDGNPSQQQHVDSISLYNQEAFLTQNQKKPSSLKTYDGEVKTGSLTEPLDLNGKNKEIDDIIKNNEPLAPYVDDTFNGSTDPDKDDKNKFLKSLGNQVKDRAKKTVLTSANMIKQKGERLVLQKKNELIRKFINEVKKKVVGNKQIYPDNVYTDQYYFKNAIKQVEGHIGQNLQQELGNLGNDITQPIKPSGI